MIKLSVWKRLRAAATVAMLCATLLGPTLAVEASPLQQTAPVLGAAAATFGVLALGLWVFQRESPRVPENS